MKPLILVDGAPIIVNVVRDLIPVASTITIVVSPSNAGFITSVVEGAFPEQRIRYVVQPKAVGVMDAVRRAMPMTHYDVMIVCADNIIPADTYERVYDGLGEDKDAALAVKTMPAAEAERFTYFTRKVGLENIGSVVHEKTPVPEGLDAVFVWLGPLAFRKGFINTYAGDTETLSGLIALAENVQRIEANCADIGVPEELP